MPHFRKTPSSRRAASLTAKWVVPGPTVAAEIKYGRRTTHLIPCKPSHHRRRFHPGQRLSVKAYVGGPTECHVTVTSAQRVQLRDVDYPVVRELGYIRVDDFHEAWVAEHEPVAYDRLHEAACDTYAEDPEYTKSPSELLSIRASQRFAQRHAHKEVWLLRFAVERALPPRLLAQNGRAGGNYRKLADGRWQYVESAEDAEADRGYTSVPALALPGEIDALTDDEWKLHIAPDALDREHARQVMLTADRASQSTRERLSRARDAASVKGLDMRSEFRRYERLMLHDRLGDAVRQLELIESRVFPRRAAA